VPTPTVKIGGTDLSLTAHITSWDGILMKAPTRGDLIELDFIAGAVWQQGPVGSYDFEVPLVMKSQDPATAVGQALDIQALATGATTTIRREFYDGTTFVMQACQGVISQAIPLNWDLTMRSKVGLVLICTNLDGAWATTT
jgi:hypothetical protein